MSQTLPQAKLRAPWRRNGRAPYERLAAPAYEEHEFRRAGDDRHQQGDDREASEPWRFGGDDTADEASLPVPSGNHRGIFIMAGRPFARSMARDLYDVLGVRPTATEEGIKRAYRRLVKRYHPDVNKGRGAKEVFLEVKDAYEVLSNPLLRREYDERTAREAGMPGPAPRPTKPGAPRKVRIPAEYVRIASPFRSYRDRIERVQDRQIERRTRTAKTVWRLYVVTVASMSGSLMVFSGLLLSAGGVFQGAITLTAAVMMLVLLLIAWVAKGMIAPDL